MILGDSMAVKTATAAVKAHRNTSETSFRMLKTQSVTRCVHVLVVIGKVGSWTVSGHPRLNSRTVSRADSTHMLKMWPV